MSDFPETIEFEQPVSAEARLQYELGRARVRIAELEELVAKLRKENRPFRDRRDYLKQYGRRKYRGGRNPHVYVITDGRGRLKVGKAMNLSARLRTLRTAIPDLAVVRSEPGYSIEEESLQDALLPFHISGEWFRDCDETRAIVREWSTPARAAS